MSAADTENTVENKIKELKQGSGELKEEDLQYVDSVLSDIGLELRDVNNVQGSTIGKMITAIPQNPESSQHSWMYWFPWAFTTTAAGDAIVNGVVPRIKPGLGKKIIDFLSKRPVAGRIAAYGIPTATEYIVKYLLDKNNSNTSG